jgi:predicted dehydrogenase
MINAAVIGQGWWGQTIARNLAESELINIKLCVDPRPEAREAAAARRMTTSARFEDALERSDIDAVILCSPHKYHPAQIATAARAGKHVFCEKPLCTNAAEWDLTLAAVKAAGVRLGVGHERRFEPAVIEMRRRFSGGEFGNALLLEANFSQDIFLNLPPDNWRLSATEAPVGPLSATGIHLVDLSIAFLGQPKRVWARLATRGSRFANGDTLSVTIEFESGVTAMLGAVLATPFMGRLALLGSRGWFDIRDRTHPQEPTGWDVTMARRGEATSTMYYPPHGAVRDNLEAFARAVSGAATDPISLEEMSWNVRTFEAITRSVANGNIEAV